MEINNISNHLIQNTSVEIHIVHFELENGDLGGSSSSGGGGDDPKSRLG